MNERHPANEKFEIYDEVYMRRTSDCVRGVIVAITRRAHDYIVYGVAWADKREESWHYAVELSREWIPEFKAK